MPLASDCDTLLLQPQHLFLFPQAVEDKTLMHRMDSASHYLIPLIVFCFHLGYLQVDTHAHTQKEAHFLQEKKKQTFCRRAELITHDLSKYQPNASSGKTRRSVTSAAGMPVCRALTYTAHLWIKHSVPVRSATLIRQPPGPVALISSTLQVQAHVQSTAHGCIWTSRK